MSKPLDKLRRTVQAFHSRSSQHTGELMHSLIRRIIRRATKRTIADQAFNNMRRQRDYHLREIDRLATEATRILSEHKQHRAAYDALNNSLASQASPTLIEQQSPRERMPDLDDTWDVRIHAPHEIFQQSPSLTLSFGTSTLRPCVLD